MKRTILFLLMMFLIQSTTFASSWVQIDDLNYIDKDSITIYTDNSVFQQSKMKTCYMKRLNDDGLYKDTEKVLNKKISYSITQWVFDFSRNMLVTKSITQYDKNGNSVDSYTYKRFELNWNTIIPDSNAEYWSYLLNHPKELKNMYKKQNNQ